MTDKLAVMPGNDVIQGDIGGFIDTVQQLGQHIHDQRKAHEEKPTPIQWKGKLPMGGSLVDYIKAPYMIDEFKKMANELFHWEIQNVTDVFLGQGERKEHWIRIHGYLKDRSTGNVMAGIGAARARYSKDKDGNPLYPINYSHDCASANTSAMKQGMKNFGIGADVYGRDVAEYSEAVQSALTATCEVVKRKFGDKGMEKVLNDVEKHDPNNDEQILKYLRDAYTKATT